MVNTTTQPNIWVFITFPFSLSKSHNQICVFQYKQKNAYFVFTQARIF